MKHFNFKVFTPNHKGRKLFVFIEIYGHSLSHAKKRIKAMTDGAMCVPVTEV